MEKINKFRKKMIIFYILEYFFVAVETIIVFVFNIHIIWTFLSLCFVILFGVLGLINNRKYRKSKKDGKIN